MLLLLSIRAFEVTLISASRLQLCSDLEGRRCVFDLLAG
jgi:hypothetical protein